jgi:hypothetical protein
MAKQGSRLPTERRGTPGLDIFKIAGRSISGYLPSWRTGDARRNRQPFTSEKEHRLSLYLEYHPHVLRYQRGDVTPQFAHARNLATPIEVPYKIEYVYEGKIHEYLPDYIGTLCDGRLLIAEAGLEERKRKGQELAKAEAARRLAGLRGGAFWIGTDKNLSDRWYQNLLYLHVRRETFRSFDNIAPVILAHWPWREERSVQDFIDQFASQWHEAEVEAAVWKIAGDAAAAGKLIVDLDEVELDLSTPLALLDPDAPPILPNPLPNLLAALPDPEDTDSIDFTDDEAEATSGAEEAQIPGPAFDPESLESKEAKAAFNRKYAAVREVLAGGVLRSVAGNYDMAPSMLSYLVKQAREHGQVAFVSHKTYQRDRKLRPEFQEIIRELYTHPIRPSVMAIYEHVRLKDKAEELTRQEGKLVLGPTYYQVWSYTASIQNESKVVQARSGLKHPPHERMSPYSFVLSIRAPGLICQVDEHFIDLLVVTLDGTVITRRVHCAVLICVKTGAILAGVLAMDSLNEEDYMRLIKQAIEPKDELVRLYQCKNLWPCFGKPAVIFHDRGNIFTSERAQQVTVERLKITTERAPAYCPSAKGTAEALLKWVVEKFAHRLPGTTKSTPKDRGAYQSAQEAKKAGITLDVLEEYFFQAIVDAYMREWDNLRKQKHFILWEEAARQYGVPKWLESQDDLKLLLMKAVNRKNSATGRYAIHDDRISFLRRWYVSPGLLNRLRGKEIDIYYDRRDVSVIYIFLEGLYVGPAFCLEFMGRRVSLWEANAERQASTPLVKAAEAESLTTRQEIQKRATSGKRIQYLETVRLEKKRQLDLQQGEIHTEQVQATIQALKQHQNTKAPPPAPTQSGLAPAVPNEDDRPFRRLAIRPRRPQHG